MSPHGSDVGRVVVVRGARRARCGCADAFTLIELLVVVAIIALLLAIFLPSLERARESARRGVCGAHLHGLMVALEAYSYDNKKQPPLTWFDWAKYDEYGSYEPTGPFEAVWYMNYLVFHVKNDSPTWLGDWVNFGCLYVSHHLPDIKACFCPSQRNDDYRFQTPTNPWPPRFETKFRPDMPWVVNHTKASFARRAEMSYIPWDRVPHRRFVLSDFLFEVSDRAVDTSNIRQTHGDGVNASFRDGHVRFIRGSMLFNWYEKANGPMEDRGKAFYQWIDRQY